MYKDYTTITKENTDALAINNSIRNILLTRRGSVPGNPRFGSDLHSLIFSQLDSLTESVAKSIVFSSLSEFENRIIINNINIKSIEEYNKIVISIEYSYKDQLNNTVESSSNISI